LLEWRIDGERKGKRVYLNRTAISVLLLAVGVLASFSVLLLAIPSEAQQGNEGCANPRQVRTFNGTQNQITPAFNITGNTFRLRYDLTDLDEDPGFDSFSIRPIAEDGIGVGDSVLVFDPGSGSQNILEGPGSFTLEIESDGFDYEVVVDDCTGTASGNAENSEPSAAQNNEPSTAQANGNQDRRSRVIPKTIPRKRLPPTGGIPAYVTMAGAILTGVGLLGVGFVIRQRSRR
jgi:hypothetical protein